MIISKISNNNFAFGAGKTTLFTNYDGSFLPIPTKDIYNPVEEERETNIKNLNKFYAQFQNLVKNPKGKFDIILNTDRNLRDGNWAFEPTYYKMRKYGVRFPEMKSVITNRGGDKFHFDRCGIISPVPDLVKQRYIRAVSGWDNKKIISALDNISEKLGVKYDLDDRRGDYKLKIHIADDKKFDEFYKALTESIDRDMSIHTKIKHGTYSKKNGILYPEIHLEPFLFKNRQRLNKVIDPKFAVTEAKKNDDFIIVAGSSNRDYEAINPFRYVSQPRGNYIIPGTADELTKEYADLIRPKIESLPAKFLFNKTHMNIKDARADQLRDFMQKTAEFFPDKVQVVEQTLIGKNNNFLDAIKSSIDEYAKKNERFNQARK